MEMALLRGSLLADRRSAPHTIWGNADLRRNTRGSGPARPRAIAADTPRVRRRVPRTRRCVTYERRRTITRHDARCACTLPRPVDLPQHDRAQRSAHRSRGARCSCSVHQLLGDRRHGLRRRYPGRDSQPHAGAGDPGGTARARMAQFRPQPLRSARARARTWRLPLGDRRRRHDCRDARLPRAHRRLIPSALRLGLSLLAPPAVS
jgi:hypothetical protein